MKNTQYQIGRENISATIFVPYDCTNRCNFCTTKMLYKDPIDFDKSFEKIKSHVDTLLSYGVTIFTLTGGEPLADIERCRKIINYIYDRAYFKRELQIYVNTSLPKGEGVENIVNYLNDPESHISGISISRHRQTWEQDLKLLANVFNDDEIKLITRPSVRINCLATRMIDPGKFIDRFKDHNVAINFRANYMKVNSENLHQKDDFFASLNELYQHVEHTECKVCDTDVFFDHDSGRDIYYHKGIYTTKVEFDDHVEVNDFVIDMFGNAYIDWIFVEENELTGEILISINENLQNLT